MNPIILLVTPMTNVEGLQSPRAPRSRAVVGIDACGGGWVGVVLDGAGGTAAVFGRTVAALLEAAPPVATIGIDIPIGLLEEGVRAAPDAVWAAGAAAGTAGRLLRGPAGPPPAPPQAGPAGRPLAIW